MYTYAFLATADTASLTLPVGIAGPTEILQAGSLAAVVEGEVPFVEIQIDEERLLRAALDHDRVIRAIFEQATVLPLRFGTRFLTADGLVTHLTEEAQDYLDRLAHLEGKAEYTLSLTPLDRPIPPLPQGLTGKEYFLARKERLQEEQLHEAEQTLQFEQLAVALVEHFGECHPGEPLAGGIRRLHILAPRGRLGRPEQLAALAERTPLWKLDWEGPLPPYRFV